MEVGSLRRCRITGVSITQSSGKAGARGSDQEQQQESQAKPGARIVWRRADRAAAAAAAVARSARLRGARARALGATAARALHVELARCARRGRARRPARTVVSRDLEIRP